MIARAQLNERVLHAEYAVRGPIVQRALELEAAGKKIIYCNIGNPLAFEQKPLSYLRQILALVEYPELLQQPAVTGPLARDLVERARMILAKHRPGTGAYTQSPGIPFVRQAVSEFIHRRDGIPSRSEQVILTDGASKGAQAILTALLRDRDDGFMIPIPQYPLYSASLTLFGGQQIGYFLDEANHWQLNEASLTESLEAARRIGVTARGLVVINPGNPTGAVLSLDNVKMIVAFAKRHDLAVIADEVYQENVYGQGCRFHSFAKVMHELGETEVPLFSLHSVSKGFLGECGHRGGYLEIRNVPEDVLAELVKLQSISLCANVPGQLATYLMVTPPEKGDESYATYVGERDAILQDLRDKAQILGEGVNRIPGMSVDVPQGAMYAFVRFELPYAKGAHEERLTPGARAAYIAERETRYCLAMLEQTGICVVPGSGFGQLPGTMHFRTTFLPSKAEIEALVVSLEAFHRAYTASLSAKG